MNQIPRPIKNILQQIKNSYPYRKPLQELSHAQFYPHHYLLGIFFNPFYFGRLNLLNHSRTMAPKIGGDILDVGCGIKPYQQLYKYKKYIGMEIDTPEMRQNKNIDVFYNGKNFPFQNASFDSVVCNQVLEHIFEPYMFLSEINRVLKENGKLFLTVPFIWDEHLQPFDYGRYSSFGLKYLMEKHGFEVLEYKKSCNGVNFFFQLINASIYKMTLKHIRHKYFYYLGTMFLTAPFTILGILLNALLPKNNDLFLDNVILVKKVKSL